MSVLRSILTMIPEAVRSFRGSMFVQLMSKGFWTGRQFRAYREFTLTANQSITLRFTASKPFLLTHQQVYLIAGNVRVVIRVGATPSGTWTALGTTNPKYRIGMEPVSTVQIAQGGTITGGTEREVILAAAGTGGAIKTAGSFGEDQSYRGLPAAVFYQTITAGPDGATGMYLLEWEDLD